MKTGHVFVIGFMGAGKSTVACLVADVLGMPCIDLDDEIERESHRSVSQIFTEDGEDAFRRLETEALLSLVERPPSVVACGGGIVVRPENRAALKDMGTIVYLHVTAGEALARVGDASTRPLLAGPSGSLAATSLLQARETLYRSVCDVEVETVGRAPEEVAGSVIEALRGSS